VRRPLILLLLPAFLLGACSGGDDTEDVQSLLDRAFSSSIESADLKLDAQLELEGSEQLKDPIRIQASGPFRANGDKLPSVDLSLRLGTAGDGQVIETGFLSTGDRAFIEFQEVYYEQPPAEVRRINRSLARREGRRRSSLAALGLDPRGWLAQAKDEGKERVAGVETRHVSGTLDVTRLLEDLNGLLRRSGSALGQGAPQRLTRTDIAQIAAIVEDPTFDVYVGVEDDTIRRISGRLALDVPQDERRSVGGIEGGTLEFSLELRAVNGDQEIETPARARPLAELTRSLGGAGALGDALGGTGGDDDPLTAPDGSTTTETTPTVPAEPTPQVPDGTDGGGTASTPDAEDFRRYTDCLDEARPDDTEALQLCTELLQR
jgi:hypothetical protein